MQLYCLYGLTQFEKEFIVKLKINSTGLRSEENREEQMKRKFFCKRNIIICCIVFCIVLCIIYISDDRQQKSYDKVYMAYIEMGNGEYQEAADLFSEYIAEHKTKLYWKLVEAVNGSDSEFTLENVNKALETCNKKLAEE